jgi:hypothetical protein
MIENLETELLITLGNDIQHIFLQIDFDEQFDEEIEFLYFEELEIVDVDDFFFEERVELVVVGQLLEVLQEIEEHFPFRVRMLLDYVHLVEGLDVLENAKGFFCFYLRGDQSVEETYPNFHLF